MSDDLTYSTDAAGVPGGTVQITDFATGSSGHMPVFKLAVSADGSTTLIPSSSTAGMTVNISTASGVGASNVRALSSGVVTLSSAVALSSGVVEISTAGGLGALVPSSSTSGLTVRLSTDGGGGAGLTLVAGSTIEVGLAAGSTVQVTLSSAVALSSGVVEGSTSGGVFALVPSSSVSGFTVQISTASGFGASAVRSLSSGVVTLSSAIALSSGTVTLSSAVAVSSGNIDVQGNVAHDSTDAGNPVKVGGKASTAEPTAVATGDRVDSWFDPAGRLIIGPYAPSDLFFSVVGDSATGGQADLTAAPGAGLKTYITSIQIVNWSTTFAGVVVLSSTDSVEMSLLPAPGQGGVVTTFPVPLQSVANSSVVFLDIFGSATLTVCVQGYYGR